MAEIPTDEPSIIKVRGRVDALAAPRLDAELQAAQVSPGRFLIVDLAGATYISSSGLRVLLLAFRRQQRLGGQFWLRNPTLRVLQAMRLAGFDHIFAFADDQPPNKPSTPPSSLIPQTSERG